MTITSDGMPVRRALLSVSDKRGLPALGQALAAAGVELLSTGGTCRELRRAGLDVTDVAEHTGFPEIMAGRVKTLHPRVHGGVLGREDGAGGGEDATVMAERDIPPIDLIVVNLYPFERTVQSPDCTLEEAVDHIDIGGPALVRAAAKNHARVTVVVDPGDYEAIIAGIRDGAQVRGALRYQLAVKAFQHTAAYDSAIANWLGARDPAGERDGFPSQLFVHGARLQPLRYGENPHQRAAFYVEAAARSGTPGRLRQLHGKALSFNNLADTDAALGCVRAFESPACVIVKHANPCGVAVADDVRTAYERAFTTDPTSAFGGIIAFNRELDAATAAAIAARQFVEVIVAPEVAPDAADALASRRNVRLLTCGTFESGGGFEIKGLDGGLLVQERDVADVAALRVVTRREPEVREWADLRFAWRVAHWVKSNAIVYARDARTIGIGAGQMSRVHSARLAGIKAADERFDVAGSVMASDAFFPFRDGIDTAAQTGISAVIQPGGSVRDEEVIAAADAAGMAMVFTDMRHFRH